MLVRSENALVWIAFGMRLNGIVRYVIWSWWSPTVEGIVKLPCQGPTSRIDSRYESMRTFVR